MQDQRLLRTPCVPGRRRLSGFQQNKSFRPAAFVKQSRLQPQQPAQDWRSFMAFGGSFTERLQREVMSCIGTIDKNGIKKKKTKKKNPNEKTEELFGWASLTVCAQSPLLSTCNYTCWSNLWYNPPCKLWLDISCHGSVCPHSCIS